AIFGEHPETVNLFGMAHNLFWVTLGNVLSGSVFMALGYWQYSKNPKREFDNP
ncbi:MAG: nitrite transporter NirC, partial [Candidatus Marinimicrobia bacterium]|nr:nitrite transporter NirC [Candidatus Neomarinimicrobiota bacterium]